MKNNLNEWLNQLEQSAKIRIGLTDIVRVAESLAVNKTQARVITVGGTNGKGSCVEMLTSVYVDAGYSVGTYTSPHLFHFNERIRIQKKPVEDALLCEAFSQVERAKVDIPLTYFDWVTLAALWIFKTLNLQVIILEVGMGGRLDATNIVDADLVIISSIDLDHTEYLGYTRDAIAQEKVGIFRKDRWAICGEPTPPKTLEKMAEKLGARTVYLGKDFYYKVDEVTWAFYSQVSAVTYENLRLPILAVNNAAVILQAILLLNAWLPVDLTKAIEMIQTTKLSGRCEIKERSDGGIAILDVAHNPHAASQLVQFLKPYYSRKIIALFSMLKDKDIEGTIAKMKTCVADWHIAEIAHARRASRKQLDASFASHQLAPQYHSSWNKAVSFIKNTLTKEDVLVIFGSFFVVSEVSPLL